MYPPTNFDKSTSHTPPETSLPLPVALLEVFMWKCPQLVCHDLLDVVHSSKMTTIEVEFEFWEKKEVTRTQIRWVWWLWNHWSTFFGQKFVHGDGSVTGSIVVMQHPKVRNLWPDTMNPFSESFKELKIVLFVNCLSLSHEFLMNNALTIEKNKLSWLWFFSCSFLLSLGAVSCMCVTSSFVVWCQDRIRKSTFHVMTCFKQFLSFSMRSRRTRHTFLRFSFCSLVRIFGTNLAQIFCMLSYKVKISWTVWQLKFNTQLIILTVKRRSDLTRSLILVIFSSVFDVQGLPERGSSSTHSRPSKNALCHLKTCVLDTACSP